MLSCPEIFSILKDKSRCASDVQPLMDVLHSHGRGRPQTVSDSIIAQGNRPELISLPFRMSHLPPSDSQQHTLSFFPVELAGS